MVHFYTMRISIKILYTTKILVSGNLFLVGLIYTMNIIAIILNKIWKKLKTLGLVCNKNLLLGSFNN